MECEFSRGEKSIEEEAELQRTTKKAKDAKGVMEFGSPPSYRDKLVGEMPGAYAQAFNLGSVKLDMWRAGKWQGGCQPYVENEKVH